MMLTADERQRYARQMLLPEVGEAGQRQLKASRVLIVGAGGLGCPAALYLAAAGIGTLVIADGDVVEASNLQRQILYRTHDCGGRKAERSAEALFALNPTIEIAPLPVRLAGSALDKAVAAADVVLDCSDNLDTRQAISAACVAHGRVLVSAAATGWDGQLMVFDHRTRRAPCYQCLYPPGTPAPVQNCVTVGVIGPLLGLLGAQQALLALQALLGMPLPTDLQLVDGRTLTTRRFALTPRPGCPCCGA